MRNFRFFILSIVLAVLPVFASASEWLRDEFRGAEYGANLVSVHVPDSNTNNGNIGLYVITRSGYVANVYYNSYHLPGVTLGWRTPEWNRFSVTLGAVYGYKITSGLDWTPAVIPELRLATFANPYPGISELNARIVFAPNTEKLNVLEHGAYSIGLWHVAAGVKF